MTIEELKARKRALGYTNEIISKLSGVPLGTVQKIFSGQTKSPRLGSLYKIEQVLVEWPGHPADTGFKYDLGPGSSSLRISESVLATFYKTEKKPGDYTIKDLESIPEDHRVELIDGYIYDMAAPTPAHQIVVGTVFAQLYQCMLKHPECIVFPGVGVQIAGDDKTLVIPDIVVLCDTKKLKNQKSVSGAPELAIEVLSPSNRDHDMLLKLEIYRKHGVREYWIIDPKNRAVAVYNLEEYDLPRSYTFSDTVPVLISEGKCSVDFGAVKKQLDRLP